MSPRVGRGEAPEVGDELVMSGTERERLVAMRLVAEGRGGLVAVARRLGVSYRRGGRGGGGGLGRRRGGEKGSGWGVVEVAHETLRRWLMGAGLWARARRRGPHRRWRAGKRAFGEMVELDGSHHDWFGTGEQACLMNFVDDATTTTLARMEAEETTEGAMRSLWGWIERYGVPLALYCDGKTVYVTGREPTVAEQLAGEPPLP